MGIIMDGNILKKYIEEEGVTRVVVPDGVVCIGDDGECEHDGYEAFSGCTHLTEVILPDSVKVIGYDAFAGCEKLKRIVIPEGVDYIRPCAFEDCEELTEFSLPESVKWIGYHAFQGCGLKSIRLPSGLEDIDDNAFFGCGSLEELVLPDPIEYVGANALDYCDGLKRITLGKSFADLEFMPFDNPNLEEIIVHPENPYYSSEDGILYNKDMTTLLCCPGGKQGAVVVPDTVTQIGDAWEFAFWHCTKLTSVQLPAGIRRVGMHSFEGCDILARDSVPADVEWFDDKVDHRM